MKIHCIIFILFIFTLFFSCESKNREEPELVTFDSVFNSKYNPVKLLGWTFHRRISLDGYLIVKNATSLRAESINLHLFEKPGSMGRSITANIQFGYNENQVEMLPKYYTNEDIKVHTKEKEVIGTNDRVRITGKRYCHKDTNSCYIIVDTIEKAP